VPPGIYINKLKEKRISADISSIKKYCDVVIVSLHWGTENAFYPSPKQIDLAHSLIDHGATLILGHHPHIIQGIETYKNGLIAYSLGNFQFDPGLSQSQTSDSMILSVSFNKSGLEGYSVCPVVIDADFLPGVSEGQEKDEFLGRLDAISRPIKNGEITSGWWFDKICGEYLSGNMKSYRSRIKRYGFRHLLECMAWLISPFCLRCYLALIKQRLRGQVPAGRPM
jgi:poly-gamma-glutamate synthesis protein (capsule biosynthesis protein)